MKCLVARLGVVALLAALLFVFAVGSSAQTPIWPTYHMDDGRRGQNSNAVMGNPATLGPIWAFPRDVPSDLSEEDEEKIVNDTPTSSNFLSDLTASNQYGPDFLYSFVVSREEASAPTAVATWVFPGTLPNGVYQILIWVPYDYGEGSPITNSPQAEYTVYDDNGATTIKFDQRDGGKWVPLTTRAFSFTNAGDPSYRIELSNLTDDAVADIVDDPNSDTPNKIVIVAADAIKFISGTGREVYASPTSATMEWSTDHAVFTDPDPIAGRDPHYDQPYSGTIPVVYIGTVDTPVGGGVSDTGSVFCINSITEYGDKITSEAWRQDATRYEDWKRANALASFLGTTIWQYPRPAAIRADELEGPIEGGIYSTPSIVPTGDALHPTACFVAGMDRQVYALDAQTGELLWQGPGITRSEGNLESSGWTKRVGEAFGGAFHAYTAVSGTGNAEAVWTFDDSVRQSAGERARDGEEGWSYAVYAWIPAMLPGEGTRVQDASYTISYEGSTGSTVTTTVKIDQSDINNHGKWVRLGLSYFNVSGVTLSNLTTPVPPAPGVDPPPASDFHVVADAVRIIPDTIDSFSYSTPAWNGKVGADGRIFAASVSGRIIGFKPIQDGERSNKVGTVRWIYPTVRTKRQPGGAADMDAPPFAPISASVAFDNNNPLLGDCIYVADFGGKLHCINNMDANTPTRAWVFPAESDVDDPGSFTSSPAVDNLFRQLFIGGTNGIFYSINTENGRPYWKYPANPATPTTPGDLPLGAFRYSTAAVANDSTGMHRVWVGSADGRIYSFYAGEPSNATAERRIYTEWDDDGQWVRNHWKYYVEPNVLSPIQGSIALDQSNSNGHPYMYVGDMSDRGSLHWFRADSGVSDFYTTVNGEQKFYKSYRLEGSLFSSPNITNTVVPTLTGGKPVSYIYIGSSDGRVFAFSDERGAWGGGWSGGSWPYGSSDRPEDRREEQLAPDTDVQFEMITRDFYRRSLNVPKTDFDKSFVKAGTTYYTMPTEPWDDRWIVSKLMKQPTVSLTGKTDKEIDDELRTQAKQRRNAVDANGEKAVFGLTDRLKSGASIDSTIYFEWGETVYIALWNLPAKQFLYGSGDSSKRSNLRFNLTSGSAGSSAGSVTRPTINVRRLEEYKVLTNEAKMTTDGEQYYDVLEYTGTKSGEVMRSFVLAEIEFRANVPRPPSPGPGWTLTLELSTRESTSSTSAVTRRTIPLARLKAGNPPEPLFIQYETTDASIIDPSRLGTFRHQPLGVNNPLAIRDDQGGVLGGGNASSLAWPPANYSCANQRYNPEAHFNGNAAVEQVGASVSYSLGKMPTMNLNNYDWNKDLGVAHGTNSREGKLGVMDRSALGLGNRNIDSFRVDAGDLAWQGGVNAIRDSLKVGGIGYGVSFPWEFGVGSADYPDIPKRRQSYRKLSDERDPSRVQTTLPSIVYQSSNPIYDASVMRPDTVFISVNVPKYQPANMTGEGSTGTLARFGYQKLLTAYVDSDRTGTWASGDQVMGRPVTYQEAYRRFKMGMRVPADPRIQVEEQTVDIGQTVHGLGEGYDFVPVNPHPEVRQWFKKITIRNAGNVNLYNLKVAKDVPLLMVRDAASLLTPDSLSQAIPGTEIRSSLDPEMPFTGFLQPLKTDPFITSSIGSNLGYTLTKPRVGDPDPSTLTIPDKRKYDNNYNNTADAAVTALKNALQAYGMPADLAETQARSTLPYSAEVSVRIPLTQPIGTYQAPFVPIWADLDGNNVLTQDMSGGYAEPFAAPTFQLKTTVRESVLTGTRQPGLLPQVEEPMPDGLFPRVGDSTPAAYRDPVTGNVRLLWSSNRMFDPLYGLYPDWSNPDDTKRKEFANAPWLLNQAELKWDKANRTWVNAGSRWWNVPPSDQSPYVPFFADTMRQWPQLLPIWDSASNAQVMPWTFGGRNTRFVSVRHFSPVITENPDADPTATSNRVFMAWSGKANVLYSEENPAGGAPVQKTAQENSLFYLDATCPGETGAGGACSGLIQNDKVTINRLARDPRSEKRHPSLAVFNSGQANDRMWMFWQGADNDRWSLYYATNDRPGFPSSGWDTTSANRDNWDMKLVTPTSLASAGSPNAVHRILGDKPRQAGTKHVFDVVYDGTTKLGNTSDVLLTRYAAVTQDDVRAAGWSNQLLPNRGAQPLPRVYSERLQRDSKFGFFTSEHLAWIRPTTQGIGKLVYFTQAQAELMLADHVGQKEHDDFAKTYDTILDGVAANSRAGLYEFYNLPHIWVVLPKDYEASGTVYPAGTVVSATDGIAPEIDAATNILTYKYPEGSDAAKVFGETVADYASGIIRFKNPLAERRTGDGSVAIPQVYADYTPQTWRLTTDPVVDNSPRAFIENTGMVKALHPGMSDWSGDPPPVDRLWVLWRKVPTGVDSSTIFWKSYRIGIDLTKLRDTNNNPLGPVKWETPTDGRLPYITSGDVTVTDALGAWEVDRTGTRIFFSQIDERYSSMLQTPGRAFYEQNANSKFLDDVNGDGIKDIAPITIRYRNTDGAIQTVKATEISWIPEAPERSLFGYASDSSVNEGSIYAFADIANPVLPEGTFQGLTSSKIWVFWTSTRGGTSDLCWATLSPTFAAR